jgi:glycosyltransferase involved in cell wall biosynthesis
MPQTDLAATFRSPDVFAYPSFHEDEASGNAAHDAVLSGLPAVVTDWCGLGQLGRNNRGGAIPTYATLGGVRYSLRSLRNRLESALAAERATARGLRHARARRCVDAFHI